MIELSSLAAEELRGLFKLESTSTVILQRVADVDQSGAIFNSLQTLKGMDRLVPRFEEGSAIAIDSLLPVLTQLHEEDHFKVLCSTPVGLLLWRIEQCLAVDASYLRRRLPNALVGSHSNLLDAWVDEAYGEQNVGEFSGNVKLTASGAKVIRLFLGLLLLRSNATVGQFIEIANHAFQYLALRSGIKSGEHARWDSRLDRDLPLVSPSQWTLHEILEASARARELTNLQLKGVAQSTIDEWQRRSIFGVYEPAFRFLTSELGSPSWAKTAIDLALSTPIDLSTGVRGEVIYVEDILPAYRLSRIVELLRKQTWNINFADKATQKQLYEELPQNAGLPSISAMYQRLANAQYSSEAYWGGSAVELSEAAPAGKIRHKFLDALLGAENYIKFVEEQYRRNFNLRLQDPVHFITSQSATLHEPILTFFLDRLVVSGGHVSGEPELAFAAFKQFCDREWARACIYADGVVDLSRYRQLFRDWCVEVGLGDKFARGIIRAHELVTPWIYNFRAEDLRAVFAEYFEEQEKRGDS